MSNVSTILNIVNMMLGRVYPFDNCIPSSKDVLRSEGLTQPSALP